MDKFAWTRVTVSLSDLAFVISPNYGVIHKCNVLSILEIR